MTSWVRFSDSASPISSLNQRLRCASMSDDKCPIDMTSSASATNNIHKAKSRESIRDFHSSTHEVHDSDSDGQFFGNSSNPYEVLSSSVQSVASAFSCDSLNVEWGSLDVQQGDQACRPRLHLKPVNATSDMHAEPLAMKRVNECSWLDFKSDGDPHSDQPERAQWDKPAKCDNTARLRRGSPILFTSQYKSVNDTIARPVARRMVPPRVAEIPTTTWIESVSSLSSKSLEFVPEYRINRRSSYNNALDVRKASKSHQNSRMQFAQDRSKTLHSVERRHKSEQTLTPDYMLTAYERSCWNELAPRAFDVSTASAASFY